MFNFQIGNLSIKASMKGILILVFPIGDHMVAVNSEAFFATNNSNRSISIETEIYHKNDPFVTSKVQGWIKNAAESA